MRKNMDMDPTKLRAAQEALGANTETETVDRALDLAGRLLGALADTEGLDLDRIRPSFHHDVLLACTVREHGRTLVTDNAGAFTRIQRHLRGFRLVAPFPG